jgi:hypothetical protein
MHRYPSHQGQTQWLVKFLTTGGAFHHIQGLIEAAVMRPLTTRFGHALVGWSRVRLSDDHSFLRRVTDYSMR